MRTKIFAFFYSTFTPFLNTLTHNILIKNTMKTYINIQIIIRLLIILVLINVSVNISIISLLKIPIMYKNNNTKT